MSVCCACIAVQSSPVCTDRSPVVIAAGPHPFPFRTRKLSLPAPMVLGGNSPGRVGRCRNPEPPSCLRRGFFASRAYPRGVTEKRRAPRKGPLRRPQRGQGGGKPRNRRDGSARGSGRESDGARRPRQSKDGDDRRHDRRGRGPTSGGGRRDGPDGARRSGPKRDPIKAGSERLALRTGRSMTSPPRRRGGPTGAVWLARGVGASPDSRSGSRRRLRGQGA